MLSLENIGKQYNGYTALEGVNLQVAAGSIHGLVGLNGSGKTTLLGIVSGQSVIPETGGFSGRFRFDGKQRTFTRPDQAVSAGIGMVHQEFALIPGMTVAENISISRESTIGWTGRILGRDLSCIDRDGNRKSAGQLTAALGKELDPDLPCAHLPVSLKQFVEMARELNRSPLKLLLLDEPTAVMGPADARRLIRAVRQLARKGTAVLYVSHRLEEVADCCHGISVLRNGRLAGCLENDPDSRKDKTPFKERVSRLMTGKTVRPRARSRASVTVRPPILETAGLAVDKPGDGLKGLDLTVYQGEILGITSLSGHGRTALGPGIMGLFPTRGQVRLNKELLNGRSPGTMIRKGVWMMPEDRRTQGLLADHTIVENMTFAPVQTGRGFVRKSVLPLGYRADQTQCRAYARRCVSELDIRCRSIFQKAGELSGGNQQKVCLAHALAMSPDLLFVGDPTRGIDIAAREAILDLLVRTRAEQGTTLVISSAEKDELRRICDRIAVLHDGILTDILAPDQAPPESAPARVGCREVPA